MGPLHGEHPLGNPGEPVDHRHSGDQSVRATRHGVAPGPPPCLAHPGAAEPRAGGRLSGGRAGIVASVLASALAFLWSCGTPLERVLIYHPSTTLDGTPAGLGLAYEDVEVTTDD